MKALRPLYLALLAVATTACGKTGTISVTHDAAVSSGVSGSTIVVVSDFKLCVDSVKLYDEAGNAQKDGDQDSFFFNRGVVDLKAAPKAWGSITAPTGFKLGKVVLHTKGDASACAGMVSSGSTPVIFNGVSQTEGDIDFTFNVSSPAELKDGSTITLSMKAFADALAKASAEATLNNSTVKTTIEAAVGTATP